MPIKICPKCSTTYHDHCKNCSGELVKEQLEERSRSGERDASPDTYCDECEADPCECDMDEQCDRCGLLDCTCCIGCDSPDRRSCGCNSLTPEPPSERGATSMASRPQHTISREAAIRRVATSGGYLNEHCVCQPCLEVRWVLSPADIRRVQRGLPV